MSEMLPEFKLIFGLFFVFGALFSGGFLRCGKDIEPSTKRRGKKRFCETNDGGAEQSEENDASYSVSDLRAAVVGVSVYAIAFFSILVSVKDVLIGKYCENSHFLFSAGVFWAGAGALLMLSTASVDAFVPGSYLFETNVGALLRARVILISSLFIEAISIGAHILDLGLGIESWAVPGMVCWSLLLALLVSVTVPLVIWSREKKKSLLNRCDRLEREIREITNRLNSNEEGQV